MLQIVLPEEIRLRLVADTKVHVRDTHKISLCFALLWTDVSAAQNAALPEEIQSHLVDTARVYLLDIHFVVLRFALRFAEIFADLLISLLVTDTEERHTSMRAFMCDTAVVTVLVCIW